MTDPFVGRAAELAVLASELARARVADPRIVVVEGPAGVGKTSLVRQFVASSGCTVLHADGDEAESQLPFGTLERLVAELDHPLAQRLASVARGPVLVPSAMAIGAEFVGLLGELQTGLPIVLWLDDVHWGTRSPRLP